MMVYINPVSAAEQKLELCSSETSNLGWLFLYMAGKVTDITYVETSLIGKITSHKVMVCYYATVFISLVLLMMTDRKVSANQVKWPPVIDLITCTLLLEIIAAITSRFLTMVRNFLVNNI